MGINGQKIAEPIYDSLGCIVGTSTNKTANNVLLIPEYEGIVVCKDKLYGVINSSGKELIPPATTNMYSITNSGTNTYYLTYEKQTLNVIDYLKNTLGIMPVTDNTGKTSNDNNTNTIANDEMNTETNIETIEENQIMENIVNQ